MFSCTSLDVKIGGSLDTAITGLLLDASDYVNAAAVHALNMLNFIYLWVPMIISILITLLLPKMDKKNRELMTSHK